MFKHWRLNLVFSGVFITLFLALIARLFQWQVIDADKYKALASEQQKTNVEVSSPRGTIFSADGGMLAYNQPAYGVYLNIKDMKDGNETKSKYEIISLLAPLLEMDASDLDERLNMELNYVPLKHKVLEVNIEQLKTLNITALRFEEEEKRIYPEGTLASHVIGFVGKDDSGREKGKYGIEGYFNGDLSGKTGYITAEMDTYGNPIVTGEMESIYARRGRDVYLTIDRGLQKIIEDGIKKGAEEYEAKSATAIVMDPKTGAILAMANYPNYDPNAYWEVENSAILSNLAISHLYEFGSVGKVFTMGAVLEEKAADETTRVEAHSGCVQIADKTVCNWNRQTHGEELIVEVLQRSCNIGTYYFVKKIGPQKLYAYLGKFGVGKMTNITMQEDATSFIKDWQDWSEVDLAASSFGQTISATPLQIISGVSAIANGGKRMQPRVVSKLQDDERTINFDPTIVDEPISKETADKLSEMMVSVVSEGGFKYFVRDIANYKIAGKTGSAQVPYEDRPGYDPTRVNATFVAFDATENRKFIMLVRIQEPKKGEYASDIAVPVWVNIFKDMAVYMGITPTE